jgi:hypothetical protein
LSDDAWNTEAPHTDKASSLPHDQTNPQQRTTDIPGKTSHPLVTLQSSRSTEVYVSEGQKRSQGGSIHSDADDSGSSIGKAASSLSLKQRAAQTAEVPSDMINRTLHPPSSLPGAFRISGNDELASNDPELTDTNHQERAAEDTSATVMVEAVVVDETKNDDNIVDAVLLSPWRQAGRWALLVGLFIGHDAVCPGSVVLSYRWTKLDSP